LALGFVLVAYQIGDELLAFSVVNVALKSA
jgi:hypothetical protein